MSLSRSPPRTTTSVSSLKESLGRMCRCFTLDSTGRIRTADRCASSGPRVCGASRRSGRTTNCYSSCVDLTVPEPARPALAIPRWSSSSSGTRQLWQHSQADAAQDKVRSPAPRAPTSSGDLLRDKTLACSPELTSNSPQGCRHATTSRPCRCVSPHQDNPRACRFYERCGWARGGRRPRGGPP